MASLTLKLALSEQERKELEGLLSYFDFSKTNTLLATPCFGGQVTEGYFRSMLDLCHLLDAASINHSVFTISNESLVTRARNSIVARFLGNPEYTHLMFIDADISFQPLAFLRLLAAKRQVVGGCYPSKTINWERALSIVNKANGIVKPADMAARSLEYVMNIRLERREGIPEPVVRIEGDFLLSECVGTGFLLIERTVFDRMIGKYPEAQYTNDVEGYSGQRMSNNYWTFFDTMVEPATKRYLSEDYAFCRKWTACGGEIWVDLRSRLTHIGSHKFQGDLMSALGDKLSPAQ